MEEMIVLFAVLLSLGAIVLWIWSIVDVVRSNFKKESDKIVWLIVVLSLQLMGTILYMIYGVKQKLPKDENLEELV